MADSWTAELAGLQFRVETRATGTDGGSTLRAVEITTKREWLRFDCFREHPHWHLDPTGQDEIQTFASGEDPRAATGALLSTQTGSLLRRAGASPEWADEVAEALSTPSGSDLLRDAQRALRHQPAVLDEVDIRQLEARRSEKWHTYPRDVLPAWVAEMDFPVAAPIQDTLEAFLACSDLGYPLGMRETGLPDVFAERMQERFAWSVDPARVEVLSEVVQGMYVALEAFSAPGERVIVQTPIYPPFLGSIADTGRELLENGLVAHNGRLETDLDALETSIDASTRLFLFCNPHNPSGRVFERSELERIAEIVLAHDLILVSDEIHADLLHDGRRHIPFGDIAPEVAARTVTLTSPSKAFNIPGLRCAIAHFGSAELQQRFNGVHPRHLRGGIGLLGVHASMAAWRWGQPWLDEVGPYLEANRAFARERLAARIPEIDFFEPEATYLAWLDCSALDIPGSPAAHFLRNGRVALSDGRLFGKGWERFVRLNFATSRTILSEVIERMAKALGR